MGKVRQKAIVIISKVPENEREGETELAAALSFKYLRFSSSCFLIQVHGFEEVVVGRSAGEDLMRERTPCGA
jgi:hypothetical protein